MKFYIDFEATQFCERIISVGCISEAGYKFESLVKPLNKYKITEFITNLTGITKDMVVQANDANAVFNQFYWWIINNTPINDKPEFICYGNTDIKYIERTLKDVTDWHAVLALSLLKAGLQDYSKQIASSFGVQQINLQRAYNTLTKQENQQKHSALEDAEMLKYIVENLPSEPIPTNQIAAPVRKLIDKAPDIYLKWSASKGDKFKVNTLGTIDNYKAKCVDSMGTHTMYFDSMFTAALWVIKYMKPQVAANKKANAARSKDVEYIAKVITKGIEKGIHSYGFSWEAN